ncbi:Benzyl alcohol O-benzoyltransferase, partial [Mucuna pruriens]
MVQRSFLFGPTKIATIRSLVPHLLKKCTTFDRCRTKALQTEVNEDVCMKCVVNARAKEAMKKTVLGQE